VMPYSHHEQSNGRAPSAMVSRPGFFLALEKRFFQLEPV
jgi:hypothetical protein